jgi:hypothetical protein
MSLADKVNRNRPEYGLVVALICMALALVIAKYSRQQLLADSQPSISNGVEEAKRPATDLDVR